MKQILELIVEVLMLAKKALLQHLHKHDHMARANRSTVQITPPREKSSLGACRRIEDA